MTERIKATVFNPSLNASFPGGLVSFFQGVAWLFAESDCFAMLRIHPINQT